MDLLFFLFYLNELSGFSDFDKTTLQAGDINFKISHISHSDIEVLNFKQLAKLEQFLNDKCLLLNPSKNKYKTVSNLYSI